MIHPDRKTLKVYHDVYPDSDALQSQSKLCAVAWAIPMKSLQTVEQPGAGSPIRLNHISNDTATGFVPIPWQVGARACRLQIGLAIAFAHAKSQLPCHVQESWRAVACVRYDRRLYAYLLFTLGAYLGDKHARRYNAMDRICLQ